MKPQNAQALKRVCLALLCSACFAVPVCAQSSQPAPAAAVVTSKFGVGRPMGDAYAAAAVSPGNKSRLVVYRNPNAQQQSVMTLYINGSYHTSLMQAGFSKICLTEPSIHVRSRLRPVNQAVNPELDKSVSLTVPKGQTQYVRVAESTDGTTQLEVVTARVASQDLPKTREQMHALSRVEAATPCDDTKTAETLEGVVLVAYVEFEAGRSRLTDMKSSDLHELDRLVEKLKAQSQNQSLMRLQVVGYANDGDKKTPSKQLAQNRAKTVEDYIMAQGVKPKTLSSDARSGKAVGAETGKTNSVVVVSATLEQP